MYKDSFGNELKDGDSVAIFQCNVADLGIYYNCQVITKNGKINISTIRNIIKLNTCNSVMQNTLNKLKAALDAEINKNNGVKVIAVNNLQTGDIIETKTGMQWLVMGKEWRLTDNIRQINKYGRLFINMENIDESLSLRENIDNLIEQCDNIEDMIRIFKFNTPKAIKVVKHLYSKKDFNDFIENGIFAIFKNTEHVISLYKNSRIRSYEGHGINLWGGIAKHMDCGRGPLQLKETNRVIKT